MDTQNDGLEKVPPFENGNFGIFLVSISGVYIYTIYIINTWYIVLYQLLQGKTFLLISSNDTINGALNKTSRKTNVSFVYSSHMCLSILIIVFLILFYLFHWSIYVCIDAFAYLSLSIFIRLLIYVYNTFIIYLYTLFMFFFIYLPLYIYIYMCTLFIYIYINIVNILPYLIDPQSWTRSMHDPGVPSLNQNTPPLFVSFKISGHCTCCFPSLLWFLRFFIAQEKLDLKRDIRETQLENEGQVKMLVQAAHTVFVRRGAKTNPFNGVVWWKSFPVFGGTEVEGQKPSGVFGEK